MSGKIYRVVKANITNQLWTADAKVIKYWKIYHLWTRLRQDLVVFNTNTRFPSLVVHHTNTDMCAVCSVNMVYFAFCTKELSPIITCFVKLQNAVEAENTFCQSEELKLITSCKF